MKRREASERGTAFRLLGFSSRVRRVVLVSVTLRIVNQGAGIALLAYAGAVVGERLPPSGSVAARSVGQIAAVLAVGAVVKAIARYLEQYTGHWAAFRLLGLLRARVYDHLQAHSARVSATERTGDLVSRVMADVDRTEVFFAHTIAPAISAAVLGTGSVVAMAVTAGVVPAAIMVLGLSAIAVGWPAVTARRTSPAARESRTVLGRLNALVVDTVLGVREVLTYRVDALRRIEEPGRRYDELQCSRARTAGIGDACIDFTIAATLVLILLLSPPAMIPLALALAAGAFGPALAFGLVFADAGVTLSAARRVFRLFDEYPLGPGSDPSRASASVTADRFRPPALSFDGVWFAYPTAAPERDAAWVHRGLSFTAPAGELVVVVGPSGCGKSTILPLVLGWYTPQRGGIDWDGGARPLAHEIAVMPQHSFVLRGTLRDNLLISRPDATDEQLRRACEDASLADWLAALPRGLDTELGVSDTTVSGGERRRLALARLLLRGAPLEFYDEPTAHLDGANAAVIRERIVRSTATRIVITHDTELLEHGDRVVRFRDGAAVEDADLAAQPAGRATGRGQSQWQ